MHARELGIDRVEDVLENVLRLGGEVRGDEYIIVCPDPKHLDENPSCSINLDSGYWHCFSCGVGGDLVDLASLVTGVEKSRAKDALKPSSRESIQTILARRLAKIHERPAARKQSISLPGPYYDGPLSDMRARGFRNETLKRWGIRYVAEETFPSKKEGETFTIRHSIGIPVRDEKGHLLCWCYRRTNTSPHWQPKYLYTPGVNVSELWFGLQHHANADEIVVVEGAIDTMWLDQCGVPALGMLGSQMGESKLMRLQRHKRVYLLGDRDQAGVMAIERIGSTLGHLMPVFVAMYPSWTDATDPQELQPVDVEIMLARAIPWARYVQRVTLGS